MTIAINVLKEKLRRKDFYIIAALGLALVLLISSGASTLSVGGVEVTSFEGRFPIMMTLTSALACALAMSLSLATIPNEYRRHTSHLVWVRGVSQGRYHLGLTLGNVLASAASLMLLYLGVLAFVTIQGRTDLLPRLAVSWVLTTIPVALCSVAASALSIKLPGMLAGVLTALLVIVGLLQPLFGLILKLMSDTGIVATLLKAVPNLYALQNQATRFALGQALDAHTLLVGLLFVYLLTLPVALLKRREA